MLDKSEERRGPGPLTAVAISLGLTGILWIVFFVTWAAHVNLYRFGILPRQLEGLRGIITAPFIHGDIWHLASNTLPFAVLLFVLLNAYDRIALGVLLMLHVLSGFGVWLFAPAFSSHIGISGIIYGLAGFLIGSGLFRKDRLSITVAIFVVLLYGGMIEGFIPQAGISWQSHLSGAITGLMLSFLLRKYGREPVDAIWEEENEDERPFFSGE
ncbi:MAG: rhomboid family intramembrane serine protease [Chitinophagales bacterium]